MSERMQKLRIAFLILNGFALGWTVGALVKAKERIRVLELQQPEKVKIPELPATPEQLPPHHVVIVAEDPAIPEPRPPISQQKQLMYDGSLVNDEDEVALNPNCPYCGHYFIIRIKEPKHR